MCVCVCIYMYISDGKNVTSRSVVQLDILTTYSAKCDY